MRGPVVHLTWHLDVGGGELFLCDLARELHRRGVDQHICTIGPRGPLADGMVATGIPVTAFGKSSKLGLVTIFRIAAFLRRLGPSLVHTHGEPGVFWGLPAARLVRVPAVSLVYQNYPESRAKMRAARLFLRWPRTVVAGSRDVARFMRESVGVPASRLHTLACGIAPESFEAVRRVSSDPPPVLLSVGRLVERKGHQALIEALPLIQCRHPGTEVVIVGEGPCRAALEAAARRAGVADSVRLPGTIYPTHDVLARARVFVFPSLVEPQGLALLEAYAAGVPVVASSTGGIPEMLEDEVDGLLTVPGSAASLAVAVSRFLDDPTLAAACASRARRRLAEFHISAIADQYLALYRSVAPFGLGTDTHRSLGPSARVAPMPGPH